MNRSREEKLFGKIDLVSLILYLLLIIGGWFSIYSAEHKIGTITDTITWKEMINTKFEAGKQFYWIIICLVIGVFILVNPAWYYNKYAYTVYTLVIFTLVLTLFFAPSINGAKSWIKITSTIRIQPTEFAKLAVCLALARYMSHTNFTFKNREDQFFVAGIIMLPMLLVLAQNDTGSALVFTTFVIAAFREGLSPLFIIIPALGAVLCILALVFPLEWLFFWIVAPTLLMLVFINRFYIKSLIIIALACLIVIFSANMFVNKVLQPHQRDRIYAMLDPTIDPKGSGWNVIQSKIAIGSGGWLGKGFLRGTQSKGGYIPEQTTDFIFCTIGEEQGFRGVFIFLLIYTAFMLRCLYMAENAKNMYTRIYGYAYVSIIFFHFAVNVAMTLGLAPVIGIPLPFFSYGGSSLVAFSLGFFILLKLYSEADKRFAI
ncbi:MAG: rod shape-determining protein RodA [Bacteroidia bacterium]|nr:rod shape-determining protein RodA [Bacteroidia bacterium]MDW8302702.1 rod shape-determining protein RodA [Bacteroidia bacterium]